MKKNDFTKSKNGSVFATRDSFLSTDGFKDKQKGLYRKVIKISNNPSTGGINVVKLQSEGPIKFKKPYNNSRAKPELYTVNKKNDGINYTAGEFVDFGYVSITENELNYVKEQLRIKNIKKNYAIINRKNKKAKKKSN